MPHEVKPTSPYEEITRKAEVAKKRALRLSKKTGDRVKAEDSKRTLGPGYTKEAERDKNKRFYNENGKGK